MKENQLREAMAKIHIKNELEAEIMENVKKAELEIEKTDMSNKKAARGWQRGLVAAAASLAIMCVGGLTAYALVIFPVKERMENIPEKEIESIVEEIDSSPSAASTYTRELTEEEKERKRELTMAYQQGRFPESELKKVEDESKVDKNVLCYVPSTAYFYLPDRALTDEELLQIIDYNEKADYALRKRYEEEYADEVQAKKEVEDKIKQENQEKGGITEAESFALAEEWLNKLFGLTPEGLEMNHYVESAEESFFYSPDGSPVYAVNYSIQGSDYYYFWISGNGELLCSLYSGSYILDTPEISLAEAEEKIQPLYQSAETYLKDTFGISDDFESVYCSYSKNTAGTGLDLNLMNFYFVREDGIAYKIAFTCKSMVLYTYEIVNYEETVQAANSADASTERIEVKLK